MQRRTLLQASGFAIGGAPALVRAAGATTLRFTPQQDLITLDPVITTSYVSRNHGYMVYDTLYGMTASFEATPQMVEGHVVSNDGKQWDLTLREGLLFHDGTKVLAKDCIASIQRWPSGIPSAPR